MGLYPGYIRFAARLLCFNDYLCHFGLRQRLFTVENKGRAVAQDFLHIFALGLAILHLTK